MAQDAGPESDWELIVIDNASPSPIAAWLDLSPFLRATVFIENRLGLAYARVRGFYEAKGDILVYVDDDNLLAPDYLRQARSIIDGDCTLGAIGGKSIPRYEVPPPIWFDGLGLDLACRDLGSRSRYASWNGVETALRAYPTFAPIGAGMVIRRAAFSDYLAAAESDSARMSLGRKGADLVSGEDNDMIMTMLERGWRIAYAPTLSLDHIIPAKRLTEDYLARYAYSSNQSWVKVLDMHGIRPWTALSSWTTPLRRAKAYATLGAWRGGPSFIKWRAACGILDGRSSLPRARVT